MKSEKSIDYICVIMAEMAGSPQYRSRFPEISVDVSNQEPLQTVSRSNEIARERLRNLRISTITDIVICICAIGITGCLIWWAKNYMF